MPRDSQLIRSAKGAHRGVKAAPPPTLSEGPHEGGRVFGSGSPDAFAAVFAALVEHIQGRCLHTPGLFRAQRPAPEVRGGC